MPDRKEEPMDIGAVTTTPQVQTPQSDILKDISELKRQVGGMSKQFTKIMAATSRSLNQQQQPHNASASGYYPNQNGGRKRYRFTKDGFPICVKCNKIGHKGYECRPRNQQQGGQ